MTPEQVRELARLAVQAALEAPLRQHPYTVSAGVRWSTIDQIRQLCDEAGIDWRKHHPRSGK